MKWTIQAAQEEDDQPAFTATTRGWAVVDGHTGFMIREGGFIAAEKAEYGYGREIEMDWGDLGSDCPSDPGLWVWVGQAKPVTFDTDVGREHDTLYIGDWRKLDDDEVIAQFQEEDWEPEGWLQNSSEAIPPDSKITLCGSARFKKEFEKWNRILSLRGHPVYTVTSFVPSEAMTKEEKQLLDEAHLAKIDNSDVVLVIDVKGYIGKSTHKEIRHALRQGKRVIYLSQLEEGQAS